MKKVLLFLSTFLFLLGSESSFAQVLKDYTPLFKALNKRERSEFSSYLRLISENIAIADQLQKDIFSELKNGLPVSNPAAGIDSMLNAWQTGRSLIHTFLSDTPEEFDLASINSILTAYDMANATWIQNLQIIRQSFDTGKDSLQVNATAIQDAEQAYLANANDAKLSLDTQLKEFNDAFLSNVNNLNQRNWPMIVDNLLHDFASLEIGVGMQSLLATYYEENPDSTTATIIRFGSAPNYQQTWGAEWNAWASFGNGTVSEPISSIASGLKPYLAGGSVSFQYRPTIVFSSGAMRLISGVGAVAESYLPARRNPAKSQSLQNKGNTTGFGPEIRLGFAVQLGNVGFYSYSTVGKGFVFNSPDYPFNSVKIVSGFHWQSLHLRFAHGNNAWANSNNKSATYEELTVNLKF